MSLVLIDYGSGNLRSVAKAFESVGARVLVTNDPEIVVNADRVVLPGVGAYGDCMRGLSGISGMIDAMREHALERSKPFLGICVGMQLLFERGLEHGVHAGLGWLNGEVTKLQTTNFKLKIPHMGWNELCIMRQHPLLAGINNGDHAYFVHSYHAYAEAGDVLATTSYGADIVAVVGRNNLVGTQFHPEKSQKTGLAILANFLRM